MSVELLPELRASLAGVGLRELREGRVFSQRELAKRAGVSPKTILDIEQGRIQPQPATIRKLAGALGMEPPQLAEELRSARQQPRLFEPGKND
jgi:transcriptional regulator with XRE-family HTH domain